MLNNLDLLKHLRSNSIIFSFILFFVFSCRNLKDNKNNEEEVKTQVRESKNVVTENRIRDIAEYKKVIKLFKDKVLNKESLKESFIESLIPLSEEEYLELYSLTHPSKKMNNLFLKIDSVIGKSAIENKGNSFKLYLEMSEYVDGEYAESYFEDLDFIVGNNKKVFCELYKNRENNKMERLKGVYKDYCE